MEKLKNVKFKESVSLDSKYHTFFNDLEHDLSVDGLIVRIQSHRTKEKICSTMMNVISFLVDESVKQVKK